MPIKPPVALVILDGFGYAEKQAYNAIAQAYTPHLDSWFARYPHTLLDASGTVVGLPKHRAGNSEVGHLTIGSGRTIPQPITIVNNAIDDNSFFHIPTLQKELEKLKKNQGTLHIMGLLSDGGVHSDEKHLYALIQAALQNGIVNIVVHPFLDGRDTPPQSAYGYLERLENTLHQYGHGTIGSIHGRWYAMDRDHNWERTQKTYNILVGYNAPNRNHREAKNYPTKKTDWRSVLAHSYAKKITDEFIVPVQLNPSSTITPYDGIIFYNFRPDRARQLTEAFVNPTNHPFTHKQIPLTFFITPITYGHSIKTIPLFTIPSINNTLKEVLANAKKTIFSIAETEKYAHVTYFFSGYKEQPFSTEERHLIPSKHTKNYIRHPKMSALHITRTVNQSLTHNPHDFYLINYANADMVGHSGNFEATVKAIECLDKQLKALYNQIVKKMNGTLIVTADHGKAEDMFNAHTGQPNTAHTTNKVPFMVVKQSTTMGNHQKLNLHKLSDIAPYILTLMQLPVPPDMK